MAYRAAIRASLAAGGACLAVIPAVAQTPPKVEHGPPPIPPMPTDLIKKPGEPRTVKPPPPPAPAPKPAIHSVLADVVMGEPDAPIEIIEYASITCAACQHFHANVLPELAAGYVLSGDAKFILRDYPTSPIPAANASAALARCAGAAHYYDTVAELFTRQTEILSAARLGELTGVLEMIGGRHGLSAAEVQACIEDPPTLAYIRSEAEHAPVATNPPVLLVNGRGVDNLSIESVRHAIDQALEAVRAIERAQAVEPTPGSSAVPQP